ncbi:hypothetical protein Tco_0205192 [Tanacetum coccineum]
MNGNKVLKRKIREVEQEYKPTTTEEKQDRRNEMKARGTLLMALLNKDQLKFHSYKDGKLLMEAIEKRYGGSKESKKVQRTILKQQYENFSGSSSKTIDQTFDRLQKLISQLEIQGEIISQEDMNLKLLRSLPSEWKTHALIWRNKVEIETISLDDLYNNLKIYELELKDSTNTSQNSQNVVFVSSNSTNSNNSTNEADNTAYEVSTTHTQSSPTSGDNLSDVVICAFLASQPNSPQMSKEDLEQIDPDDLEEMDLQWEMAMLKIIARRFIKRIGRQLDVNGKRVGFVRSKVECYNLETPNENALVAQDGIEGYDWSYQAEEEHPTNFSLMAHTSLGSYSSSDSKNNRRSVTVETPNENALVAQDGIEGYDWSYQTEEEHPTNFALMTHTLIRFLENISMNYVPVVAGNQTNGIAGTRDNIVTGQAEKKTKPKQEYILIPICTTDPLISQDPKVSEEDAEEKPTEMDENGASDKDGKDDQATRSEFERLLQQEKQIVHPNNTNSINTVSTPVSAAGPSFTNDIHLHDQLMLL